MPDASIVIARPAQPSQLVLLFHGVGSSAAGMEPVGQSIARARPQAMVVSVDAPYPSTLGSGREWFSVVGITEQNRPQRVAEAVPLFLETIAHWQQVSGVLAADTALVGFSQGAILALESTQVGDVPASAERIIALAGRFAVPVRRAPPSVHYHLVHGEQDIVVPARLSSAAAGELQALGADVSLDLLPGLGHGIDERVLRLVAQYLGGRDTAAPT